MSAATQLNLDEQIVSVLIKCTRDGLVMAGLKPNPVGLSKHPQSKGTVSSIIGFVGPFSGSMIINPLSDLLQTLMALDIGL